MNWGALKTTGVWLHALVSAAIVGAAEPLASLFFAAVDGKLVDGQLTAAVNIDLRVVGMTALIGAARATFMHLKKVPLPPLTWPDPVDRQRGAGRTELLWWLLALLVAQGLMLTGFFMGKHRGRAEAFEQGLATLRLAPRPVVEIAPSNSSTISNSCPPVEPDACEVRIAEYRRTEAANRADARELGLNEGLRLGREDWYICGAWERERFR